MIREKNPEGFLSAAEIPLFKLYMVMSACFLAAGIIWVSILCKNTYNVFKIHWLMAALAFTKSVSLLLHSVRAWVCSREVRLGPRGQGSSAAQSAPHTPADASPGRSLCPPVCPSVLLLWPAGHPPHRSACPSVPL